MTERIHIYCDESCHLENDHMRAMVKASASTCSKRLIACDHTTYAALPRNAMRIGQAKKTEAPVHGCTRASDTPSTHGR